MVMKQLHITLELPEELAERLEHKAEHEQRPILELVQEALENYLEDDLEDELEDTPDEEILKAIYEGLKDVKAGRTSLAHESLERIRRELEEEDANNR